MISVDTILCADYVLTMNKDMEVIRNGAAAVKNGMIEAVGTAADILGTYESSRIIAGTGRAILPGLINTHTHAAMVYFRGLADDLPLKDWLEKHIWPAEGRWLSPQFVEDAVELACMEMIRAGVTTFADMYFYGDSSATAVKKMGLRAVLGAGIVDFPTMTGKCADDYIMNAGKFIAAWQGDEMITPCISPHSAYACSPETLIKIRDTAERLDVMVTTHISETEWEVDEMLARYGKRPVEHFASLGMVHERLVAAHCVHVDEKETDMLVQGRAGISHCIESNLKLASGIAPVPRMLAAGLKVTFGTDGAASNNDLNVLGEMSTAAKLHKAVAKDPTVLDSKTALLMATRWGAEVLGLGNKVGSIETGKRADIISVALSKPHLVPLYDIYSHLVYSATASDVEEVMVNGKLLLEKGKAVAADEDEIVHKARQWGERIALSDINPVR